MPDEGDRPAMSVTYYKRYRLEADLRQVERRPARLTDCRLVPWSPERLAEHAEAKHHAFRDEIDAGVFPCFTSLDGCRRLMEEIAAKPGFLPEATWLIEAVTPAGVTEPLGTVQGVRLTPRYGGIQNLGVTPWGRGRGLGSALLTAALTGFYKQGLQRATLEVTATNTPALRLYQSHGFRRVKTSYRAVEPAAV